MAKTSNDRLRIPENLSDARVLFLGCGDLAAIRLVVERGASRVIAIDLKEELLRSVADQFTKVETEQRSYWDLPEGEFDLILVLSPLYHENHQRQLFDRMFSSLAPDGLLIVEYEAYEDWQASKWHLSERDGVIARFPTLRMLFGTLMGKYSPREVRQSPIKPGELIKKFVIHAKRKMPTIIVIGGESWSGKSSLARTLNGYGIQSLHVDNMLGEAYVNRAELKHPFIDFVQKNMNEMDVSLLTRRLNEAEAFENFASYILLRVPEDDDVIVLEGYPFSYDKIYLALKSAAEARGYRVVKMSI